VNPWCCCALAGVFCTRCAERFLMIRRFRKQLAHL
jgi:hypothetical protein